MEQYAGIAVSLEQGGMCIVDAPGKIVKEAKVLEAVMDLYAGEPQMSGHEHCPQAVPVRCL